MNPLCLIPFLCLLLPPAAPVIPDGQGGFVPFTNARVMPDGSLRPYDPTIDGIMMPDGGIVYPYQPYPGPPGPIGLQGTVTVGPPEPYQAPQRVVPPHHARHVPHASKPASEPCYGATGAPIEPAPPGCRTQAPLPESGPKTNPATAEPDHDRAS
jgi:hypothetical protein